MKKIISRENDCLNKDIAIGDIIRIKDHDHEVSKIVWTKSGKSLIIYSTEKNAAGEDFFYSWSNAPVRVTSLFFGY